MLQPQARLSPFSTPQITSARQMLSVVIVRGSREICWTLAVIDGWGTDQTWLEITSWVAVIDGSSLVIPTAQALAGTGREPSVPLKGRQGTDPAHRNWGWKRGRGCCLPPLPSPFSFLAHLPRRIFLTKDWHLNEQSVPAPLNVPVAS